MRGFQCHEFCKRQGTRWLARTHPASTRRSQPGLTYPSFHLAVVPPLGAHDTFPRKVSLPTGIMLRPDLHCQSAFSFPVDRGALSYMRRQGEKSAPAYCVSRALDLLTRTHQRPDLGGLEFSPPRYHAQQAAHVAKLGQLVKRWTAFRGKI